MQIHNRIIKRGFDLVLAVVGLFLLWPLILGCILLARYDTGLSGLFEQIRVGRHGKPIKIRKIRTMKPVPGMDTTVTVVNDQRITRVGRFFRRWKLDELPQLWNVLIGDMSFVGPRPDVPGYADQLEGEQRSILQMRPGITGPATIKYTNEEALLGMVSDPVEFNDTVLYPDKVRLNLNYWRNWSLWSDIYYILITLRLLAPPVELRVPLQSISDKG